MPRLRATPRATQPLADGGVAITLTPEPERTEPIVYGSSAYKGTAASSAIVVPGQPAPDVQVRSIPLDQPRIAAPSAGSVPADGDDEDDALAALKKAEKRAQDRARAAEQDAAAVRTWGQQQAETAARAVHGVAEANLDTLTNALAAAESEAEAAETAMVDAKTKADFAAEVKAQRLLMKAEQRIATLQAGKDELEQRVKTRPAVPQPPAPAGGNVEAVLANLPNLMPEERDWIRAHPEAISPQKQQMLTLAYQMAQQRGITRGSPEYFAFFNDQFGFKDGGVVSGDDPEEEEIVEQPVRETRRVAAPVSRSGGAGGTALRPGQIVLTAAQREAARYSGVSEVDYARGLQRLREAQGQGLYGRYETK